MKTTLTEKLGLEIPIVSSGMNRIAGPDLVAAVSEAGGLGVLAGLNKPPETLRAEIAKIRALTKKPFGVNFWMHPAVWNPPDPAALDAKTLEAGQKKVDELRARAGLPAKGAVRLQAPPKLLEQGLQTILDERVAVLSTGLGDPGRDVVQRCHERGVQVMAMVASVAEAVAVAESGVDFVVAQGAEAGGHRSSWTDSEPIGTISLVPQVCDAVKVPVIASGGIADGRGMAAALALGAAGVLLGTRFVATRECQAADYWKRELLTRPTVLTNVVSGLPARMLQNRFTREYDGPVLPPLLHRALAQDLAELKDPEWAPMFAGQSGKLARGLPGAGEVVKQLARECAEVLQRLK